MSTETVITPGQAPAAPVVPPVAPAAPAPVADQSKPVGGLEGNGQVAPAAKSVDPDVIPPNNPAAKPEVPPKPVVPEKYDLKLSDGSLLKPDVIEQVATFAKSNNLTQEQAAALLSNQEGAVKAFADQQKAEYEAQVAKWTEAAKNDPQIGGDQLPVHAEMAKRAVNAIDPSGYLDKLLDASGRGNDPAIIKILSKLGKQMNAPAMVPPGNGAGGQRSMESTFYPDQQT